MTYYSLKEIVESLPKKKNSRSSLWVRLFIRKISFIVTYLFINLGISANATSVISVFVALIGSVLLCINQQYCLVAGAIIINFWLVLDCVDGNIARCKKKSSYMGEFFDAMGGYAATTFSIFGVGVAAYHTSGLITKENAYLFIILGAFAAVCNLFSRLVFQRYTVAVFTTNHIVGRPDDMPETYTEDKKSFSYFREQVDKQFGICGLFMILLLIAPFINIYDLVCIIYSAYYILAFVISFFMFCVKAKKYDEMIIEEYGNNIKK